MNQSCESYQDTLSFLKTWGLEPAPGSDKAGHYFDVSAPPYWLDNRKRRFQEALEQRPAMKHSRSKAKGKTKAKAKTRSK
jgi:hypothetical protein